jgi:GMP synthase-like glutamine amidotransferase
MENTEQKGSNNLKNKKIYIINNYNFLSERIPRLEKIIERRTTDVQYETIYFKDFSQEKVDDGLGIILSGSSLNVSDFYNDNSLRADFEPQLEFIRKTRNIPILAICFGFHLSAFAFGIKVERMPFPHIHNSVKIKVKRSDELIPRRKMFVDVHHSDYVSPNEISLKDYYKVLSSHNINGIHTVQYMQHLKRPIFSVQFHPETKNYSLGYINRKERSKILKAKKLGEILIENFVLFSLNYSPSPIKI